MTEPRGAAVGLREVPLSKINLERVISCGVVTGFICVLLKALVEEPLFDRPFFAALQSAGSPVRHELPATFLAVALTATVAVGVSSMWMYASIRPRYGPGAKT